MSSAELPLSLTDPEAFEAQQLLEHFDKDKNGTVSFDEFLTALKVSVSLC